MNTNLKQTGHSMRHLASVLAPILLLGSLAACSNLDRSRDLANPDVSGRTLAQQVCSNCHGVTGASVSPNFPQLAGQQAGYLEAQLKGFRSHQRHDPAGFQYMWGLSRSLTDRQITELANYYAGQTPMSHPSEGTQEDIQAGQKIFQSGAADHQVAACFACHGDHAQGNGTIPRLAGQHADYVIKQLKVFQRGDERPEGAIMTTVSHNLSDGDIRHVAAYVASLQK
ncbi:MAG TPA: c-type cytochrome [Aquabacterium sp.]|nr:c-type cytochrome [Aquabacterium sp.]